MRRFVRGLCVLLLAALALPCATRAAAADFDSYEVDLAAQAFNRTLPFDVSFFVTGAAGDMARTVKVTIEQIEPQPSDTAPTIVRTWEADTASDKTKFRILVPPLEAQRTYRFTFEFRSNPTPEQTTQFQAQARTALQPLLTTMLPRNGIVTDADSLRLRRTLSEALTALLPSGRVIKEGTLFDLEHPKDTVVQDFNAAVFQIIGRNQALIDRQGDYAVEQPKLLAALNDIRGSQALARLAMGIKDSQVPAVRTLLQTFGAGLDLAALDDAAVSARAAGAQPVTPPGSAFTSATIAADAAAYSTNFARTQADADALRRLLEALIGTGNNTLLPMGTSAADRTALRALVDPQTGPVVVARETAAGLSAITNQAALALTARDRAIGPLMSLILTEHLKVIVVPGETYADGDTASSWYVGADAGIVYGFRIGTLTPYAGANIYFRPVNKAASLKQAGSFGRRFSMTVGITLRSIEEASESALTADKKTRTGIFDDTGRTLLLGAGLRVTRSLRLSAGSVFVREKNPNPLITRHSVTTVPYVSFSLDMDLVGALQGDLKSFLGGTTNAGSGTGGK